jgi:hypothetical protein
MGSLTKNGKVVGKYGKMAARAAMRKIAPMIPSSVMKAVGTAKKILPGAVRQVKNLTGLGRRFKKGSPEAKAHMAKLRAMRK